MVPKSEHEKSPKFGRAANPAFAGPTEANAANAGGALPPLGMGFEPTDAG
jgi:TctA family transporter